MAQDNIIHEIFFTPQQYPEVPPPTEGWRMSSGEVRMSSGNHLMSSNG